MKRRPILALAVTSLMIGLVALGSGEKPSLLVNEWSARAPAEKPPVAVLIEMGLKDSRPTVWEGRALATAARVVHREGYRFRPEDRLVDPDGWRASTHRAFQLPARPNPAFTRPAFMSTFGIVLHLRDIQPGATLTIHSREGNLPEVTFPLPGIVGGPGHTFWNGQARVRRISAATPVVMAKTEDDFPAAAYGPDGTLWLAYISYSLRREERRIEQNPLPEQPADFHSFLLPTFADQLMLKYFRQGQWSGAISLTGPSEDLHRATIAVNGKGEAHVVYSAFRQGTINLYERIIRVHSGVPFPGPEKQLTTGPGPHIDPILCTVQDGSLRLAYQRWDEGHGDIAVLSNREGMWTEERAGRPIAKGIGNSWHPALMAGPGNRWAMAYDAFQGGDYDVQAVAFDKAPQKITVAGSKRFEARPSLAFDAKGRLWIAYEEGPEQWGMSFGALDRDHGNPLYNHRSVRVVFWSEGKLFEPTAPLPKSESPDKEPVDALVRYSSPQLGIDGHGRLWLTYRQKGGFFRSTRLGPYWLTMARRLDGDHWTEPIEIHHSDGMLDERAVLLPHPSGGLLVIHNTDGRLTTPELIDNQIYASVVDWPGEPIEPQLKPHDPGSKEPEAGRALTAAVERIRSYRMERDGKSYRLLRGDFHRHTELSRDGGADGSLEDMYRYALDTAALDWIATTDHDSGTGREYSWWLIQKEADAYHLGRAFTPLFAYERSVAYPHGHRNCLFERRGVLSLPRLEQSDPEKRVAQIHADDTKMLYRYLRELDGICASHTSATDMGTDWRDNDRQLEPIVEIYQGDRMSYEIEGAPRAGYDPKSGTQPAQIGGWRPAGFVNLALQKGYRLGFESSSDHWSTHISYSVVLAERNDRASILAALRQRHCYAATDNIILDVRSGPHWMGDEFRTNAAPALQIHVVGTGPLERVEILKDSQVAAALPAAQAEYQGAWTDPKPSRGVHYYYVRVQQTNGELAWSSPMWIDFAP
jgi:hypothetical protein